MGTIFSKTPSAYLVFVLLYLYFVLAAQLFKPFTFRSIFFNCQTICSSRANYYGNIKECQRHDDDFVDDDDDDDDGDDGDDNGDDHVHDHQH